MYQLIFDRKKFDSIEPSMIITGNPNFTQKRFPLMRNKESAYILSIFSFELGFLRNRENSADVFPGTERRSNLPCTIDKKLDYYRPKTKT